MHRSKPEPEEEIRFMNILDRDNVPLARPVKISSHKLEEIESDELYFISIFEKAEGVDWDKKEHTSQNFFNAGKALGKIYRIYRYNQYLEIAESVIPDKYMEEFKDELTS